MKWNRITSAAVDVTGVGIMAAGLWQWSTAASLVLIGFAILAMNLVYGGRE